MSFFHLLQVIIAIIFIYLTLSLLVTEIQEAFAGFLQFRAKNLKDSIKVLFGEIPGDTETLTDKIYKTHRIKSLNQYTSNWLNLRPFYTNLGPSYIKKEDFADAVLEYLNKELDDFIANPKNALNSPNLVEVDTIIQKIEEKIKETTDEIIENTKNLPQENYVQSTWKKIKKNFNKSNPDLGELKEKFKELNQKLEELNQKLKKDNPDDSKIDDVTQNIKEIKQIIKEIQNKQQRVHQLTPLLKIAQSIKLKRDNPQLQDFREELESLFEKAEERTIGVYKRNAKGVSFLIGLILAVFLNVDFFYILDTVATNPESAASLTSVAEEVFKENLEVYNKYEDCLKKSQNDKNIDCTKEGETFHQGVKKSIPESSLSEIFGRRNLEKNPLTIPVVNRTIDISWIIRVPGWIISAIAMAMGAPFWFDLLGKFLNVRNAAKPFELKPTVSNKQEDKKRKLSDEII